MSARERRRVYLEVTETIASDLNTGIQRVVRHVMTEAESLQSELNIECIPIRWLDGRFYQVGSQSSTMWFGLLQRILSHLEWASNKRLAPRTITNRILRAIYRNTPLPKLKAKIDAIRSQVVEFMPGDTMLLVDASWHQSMWDTIREAKASGCSIGCVSHDLIPLEMPHVVVEQLQRNFKLWFTHVAQNVDYFIAVSQHVQKTLQQYLAARHPERKFVPEQFESFRLGADFADQHRGQVREEVASLLGHDSISAPFLCVGTICPHKNHMFLLDAFDNLLAGSPEARLVIVGKEGWLCDDIVRRIRSHPAAGRALFWYNDLSDAELAMCYRHSKALVAPSMIEGFGLPLVEAAQYGLPVLASDTAIHREVGGGYCDYYSLQNVNELVVLMRGLQDKTVLVRNQAGPQVVSWRESTRQLLTKAIKLSAVQLDRERFFRSAAPSKAA